MPPTDAEFTKLRRRVLKLEDELATLTARVTALEAHPPLEAAWHYPPPTRLESSPSG